jgi:NADH-ubiquinone oxidoreductase chain 4
MLLAIIQVYSYLGATDFALLSVSEISLESQKILWLAFFLAFAIKTPLWPFTGWLFRAHVEAPLSGSVILAAVILKLATYAYLRIMISFLPDATHFYSPLLQGICIITLIYASLSALRSHDSKALVALSSISHCALIVLGLFSNTIIGIEGGVLVSLGHGFISPALFIIVGGIVYTRTHSRVIQYIRGLTTYMPLLGIFFLIFALANASIPLTAGWVGEQMTLIGLFERSPVIGALGALSIFLTACYSIFLYNRLMFGTYSEHLKPLLDIDRREFIVLFTLLIPTVLFGIWPYLILDSLHSSVSDLIYNIPYT